MIARGFKPVGWVAAVAAPALVCYGLSLKVAAERAALDQVEARIVSAQQDIRSLQTELDTRGRLQQLEQWNAEVLALSAPAAGQFVRGDVSLARFDTRSTNFPPQAEVQLATGQAPRAADPVETAPRQASLERAAPAEAASPLPTVQRASLTPERTTPPARGPEATEPAVRRASLTQDRAAPLPRRAETGQPTVRRTALSAAATARTAPPPRRAVPPPVARNRSLVSADTQAALGRQARSERGGKRD